MLIFKNIFKQKKLSKPIDYSSIKTDIHSHLIPGIDDGASVIEESIELVSKLRDFGFSKIITTPHLNNDFFKNSKSTIEAPYDELIKSIINNSIDIIINYAAEYLIDDGFEEKVKTKSLLTVNDSNVLVELSYYYPPQNLNALIFELQIAGYSVILAHPERYSYWYQEFNQLIELKSKDVMLQINLLTLIEHYGKNARLVAEKLIDLNMVDFVGTDLHHLQQIELLDLCRYQPYLDKLLASGKLKNPNI